MHHTAPNFDKTKLHCRSLSPSSQSSRDGKHLSHSGRSLSGTSGGFLIEGSRVAAAHIRLVRTGNLQPGHWTRASCIMEPVKRFSAESSAWKCTLWSWAPTPPQPSSITLPLPIHRLYPPPGDRRDFRGDVNLSRSNFTSHRRSDGASFCALMSPLSAQRPLCSPHGLMLPPLESLLSLTDSHYSRYVGHTTPDPIPPATTPPPPRPTIHCIFLSPVFHSSRLASQEFCEPSMSLSTLDNIVNLSEAPKSVITCL